MYRGERDQFGWTSRTGRHEVDAHDPCPRRKRIQSYQFERRQLSLRRLLSVGSNSRARYQTRRGGPAGGLPFVFSGRRATVTDSPSLTRRSGRPRPRLHAGMRNPLASAATERPARWPARDIRIARPGAPPRPAAPRARRALAGTPEAGRRRLHPVQMQIAEIKPLFRGDAEVYRTPELGRPPRHPTPYSSALPDPDVPLRSLIYG